MYKSIRVAFATRMLDSFSYMKLSSMIATISPMIPSPKDNHSMPELHNCIRIANRRIASPLIFFISGTSSYSLSFFRN